MTYTRHLGDVVCSPREPDTGRGALSKKVGERGTFSGPAVEEVLYCVKRLLGGGIMKRDGCWRDAVCRRMTITAGNDGNAKGIQRLIWRPINPKAVRDFPAFEKMQWVRSN